MSSIVWGWTSVCDHEILRCLRLYLPPLPRIFSLLSCFHISHKKHKSESHRSRNFHGKVGLQLPRRIHLKNRCARLTAGQRGGRGVSGDVSALSLSLSGGDELQTILKRRISSVRSSVFPVRHNMWIKSSSSSRVCSPAPVIDPLTLKQQMQLDPADWVHTALLAPHMQHCEAHRSSIKSNICSAPRWASDWGLLATVFFED